MPVLHLYTQQTQNPYSVFVSSTVDKIQEWFNFLEKDSKGNGDIAVMGFCFGGSYSFSFADSAF